MSKHLPHPCHSCTQLDYINQLQALTTGKLPLLVFKSIPQILGGSNMTGIDFFKPKLPNTYLHMSVFNVLPSGVNTIFPTFWKHPNALSKKGLWLAAYPLPNSLDDGVVVRKPHALQV